MADARARRLLLYSATSLAMTQTAVGTLLEFVPRNFSGAGNNIAFPAWGSTGITQMRVVAGADYAGDVFTPPGDDRPTAREVMSDVFLSTTATVSTKNALFVAWAQLLTYDLSLTVDNGSEPFDIACDDGGGVVDVWCPLGTASDEIPFSRSNAAVSGSVRNPVNYATSYIDLDYVYGRSEEEADAFRSFEGGFMNVTETGVPFQNANGTWMIPDQRTARFPVTFALHIMLLLEHNRCCVEVAPDEGYEGDEDIYQACRGWTIAIFQHMTANDFIIRLLGGTIYSLGRDSSTSTAVTGLYPSSDTTDDEGKRRRTRGLSNSRPAGDWLGNEGERPQLTGDGAATETGGPQLPLKNARAGGEIGPVGLAGEMVGTGGEPIATDLPRRRLYSLEDYDDATNAAADVFTLTAGAAAFESALPSNVRIVSEGYVSADEDNIELTVACEDLAGLFERNDVGDILRGAVLSPALAVDAYYSAAVSNLSPLFKLPVDAVQRGRDHGLPSYNSVREAYGLSAATEFSDITADASLAALISDAYGGDIENVDAVTGALAEDVNATTGSVFGDLLFEAWVDQLFRTISGDRFYHFHSRSMETVANTTLSEVINRTLHVTDLPLSTFVTPSTTVCASDCETVGEADVTLSDSFGIAWQRLDDDTLSISLKAKGIGEAGMLGIGWGGVKMYDAQDFVICEVTSATEGECIDRSSVSTRSVPSPDLVDPALNVTGVSIEDDWTTITFLRDLTSLDDEDYDLAQDIDDAVDTLVIYSYRQGTGVGQHPNGNRGASTVNFATGDAETECEGNDDNFVSLHGALMLIAWMLLAPLGIYYIRYRKGETVEWAGREWYEMHEEIMIVTSEAVLPLAITAVFASGGEHGTSHAHWGYYMTAAVAAQIFTGWIRTKGLEAKHANFSILHRFNKHFHIWAGRFAYLAGVVQCYRGLELVSGSEDLIFAAVDGLDLQMGSFGTVKNYVFPTWLALMVVLFTVFETRKQYYRFFMKGSAHVCACVNVVNEEFADTVHGKSRPRLMARTEDLMIYSVLEFNNKVLNGQSWVLVDGAILDVSTFSQRHPGGARLILNAVGTDVTDELLGAELSVGHAMAFSPFVHPESAWEIVRSLVVGYIEEDDDDDDEEGKEGEAGPGEDLGETEHVPFDRSKILPITRMPSVMVGGRMAMTSETVANKARKLSTMVPHPVRRSLPERVSKVMPRPVAEATAPTSTIQSETTSPAMLKRAWSSKRLLESFHVCPLLFREKMETAGGVIPGDSRSKRPVYRYIFSCPGQAQALVNAITGVCYVNMRAQENGKGVIQRSYNAFAVRVQDAHAPYTGEGSMERSGAGARARKLFPAGQKPDGTLCIEIRIKLHHDGTMSKLLENLANDTDNPAVQLQGPFVIQKLVPPPAHRNVVMIAAGTGVNPMVQQIRDYLALPRDDTHSSRSRLALVWQSTSEAELYGTDEITELQAKSNGLLEVTVLVSGDSRKRNIPGAAFAKAKKKLIAGTKNIIASVGSSASSPVVALPSGRPPSGRETPCKNNHSGDCKSNHSGDGVVVSGQILVPPTMESSGVQDTKTVEGGEDRAGPSGCLHPSQALRGDDASTSGTAEEAPRFGPTPSRLSMLQLTESHHPSREHLRPTGTHLANSMTSVVSDCVGSRARGKVNRDVLDKVFGPALLTILEAYGEQQMTKSGKRLTGGESETEKGGADSDEEPDVLSGSDTVAGKLQVVVSGPSGFVFNVETILAEMGVPSGAIVLLD